MSAKLTMTVHLIRHASIRNARTHAGKPIVALEHSVRSITTDLNALAHLVFREILLSDALRLSANLTLTVDLLRNVTIFLKDALKFVKESRVEHQMQTARPEITKSLAPALLPCKEMAMSTVGWSVRKLIETDDFLGRELSSKSIFLAQPIETGCKTHKDCPSLLACYNGQCQSPCTKFDHCTGNQQCVVQDPTGNRPVVACICPDGMLSGPYGNCQLGLQLLFGSVGHSKACSIFSVTASVECQSDYDCQSKEICHEGSCQDACKFKVCGLNALCTSSNHKASCACHEGYQGDPTRECQGGNCHDLLWRKKNMHKVCYSWQTFLGATWVWVHNQWWLSRPFSMWEWKVHQPLCIAWPLCKTS